jgi:glyoxylase-like metal-dependent hydrolase (beta-lactamase superfamily II)
MTQRRVTLIIAGLIGALALVHALWQPAAAQAGPSHVERLYILNCGEGVAGDISRWSPGVNVGQSMDFVDSCYLIKHSQGWLLWDTGLADTVAAMPDGLRPADPRAILWRRPKTLAAQLDQLGVKPVDIKYVAVSHSHPDHIGNVELFPQSMLLVQKAEYEGPAGSPPRFKPDLPVTKLEGDRDVFGDGSVTIIATPGHTAGHQSLLVKLPKTGAVLLSGDTVHFKDNWDNRRVPSINFSREQTSASMQKIADIIVRDKAQIWINHDKAQRDGQRLSPDFYE